MAWSMADIVGWRRLPAAVAWLAVRAVRRRRIMVRTRVRLARLTSARWRDCAARFKTDFFFFLTLVACPCAIYCSFYVSLKLLTLNEAHGFVKRAEGAAVFRWASLIVSSARVDLFYAERIVINQPPCRRAFGRGPSVCVPPG